MPLVNIHLLRGRNDEDLRTLLDAIHDAQVAAFDVPDTDRYQVLTQHDPGELITLDTGLGYRRSPDIIVIHFVSRRRTREAKVKLYELLARFLEQRLGINGDDLIVTITENSDADWSFGAGRAQFLTGELAGTCRKANRDRGDEIHGLGCPRHSRADDGPGTVEELGRCFRHGQDHRAGA